MEEEGKNHRVTGGIECKKGDLKGSHSSREIGLSQEIGMALMNHHGQIPLRTGHFQEISPPSRGRYEDDGRRVGRFDDRDFPSKADDDNHWGSSMKFVPAISANGSACRVSKYDFSSSRPGPSFDNSSKADDSDSWAGCFLAVLCCFSKQENGNWSSGRKKETEEGSCTWTEYCSFSIDKSGCCLSA